MLRGKHHPPGSRHQDNRTEAERVNPRVRARLRLKGVREKAGRSKMHDRHTMFETRSFSTVKWRQYRCPVTSQGDSRIYASFSFRNANKNPEKVTCMSGFSV